MVAKLDAKAEQAAATGQQLDDERADSGESENDSPPSAKEHKFQAACGAGVSKGPAQKRPRKQQEAVWESACKLPSSAAPRPSAPTQVSAHALTEGKCPARSASFTDTYEQALLCQHCTPEEVIQGKLHLKQFWDAVTGRKAQRAAWQERGHQQRKHSQCAPSSCKLPASPRPSRHRPNWEGNSEWRYSLA